MENIDLISKKHKRNLPVMTAEEFSKKRERIKRKFQPKISLISSDLQANNMKKHQVNL